MKELSSLNSLSEASVSLESLTNTQRITFYSTYSNVISVAVLIFCLVDRTINLDKSSLFFIHSLPFRKKEVHLAYLSFKLSFMYFLFLFFSFLIFPAISLVTKSFLDHLLLFISLQITFIATLLFIEFLSLGVDFLCLKVEEAGFSLIKNIFNFLLLSLTMLYFFNYRFKLEPYLAAKFIVDVENLIRVFSLISLFSFIVCLVLVMALPLSERMNYSGRFIKVPLLEKTVFRVKSNWSLISLFLLTTIILAIQSGFRYSLFSLAIFYSFNGVLLLPYADISADFRTRFDLLRITEKKDYFCQVLLILTLQVPLLFFIFMGYVEGKQIVLALNLAFAAIILGYLFPKSEGTINETSSLILLIIIIALINLSMRYLQLSFTVLISLSFLHYFIIRKVRNEKN
ncbi:MAG: hypothetical protein ACK5LM_05385 [Lactovum sp.]